MRLNACKKLNELSSNSPVISSIELDGSYVNVKLPTSIKNSKLYELVEINDFNYRDISPIIGSVHFDNTHPWVDIPEKYLDMSIGKHVYKICFFNSHSNSIVKFYFGYTIQSELTDKKHIYMDR